MNKGEALTYLKEQQEKIYKLRKEQNDIFYETINKLGKDDAAFEDDLRLYLLKGYSFILSEIEKEL